ncbi:MAG TPA: bifunctional hydroxymethylpyrimidine kinase/phosphomethylpyrimidine kinase [Candidatus Kapabacteria bacterium]|nr:bifunctional hydroxymethylpyrimidine kinase/phosphomethylpyrimidine kinase [Candidatus Kapabacteria bacterium]
MRQALTIAGSDSSGGAGIQADLKTFQAHGVYGASVITSVTAQNTDEVRAVHTIPVDNVAAQMFAVLDDLAIDAAKTGMLPTPEIVETVAVIAQERKIANLVVDPVMISSSGQDLMTEDAIKSLIKVILPVSFIVTPNIAEAERLAGMKIESAEQMEEAAKRIHALGCANVLIKGGHSRFDPATDILYDGATFESFSAPYIKTKNTHGTGCTYSAAITARLALGEDLKAAIANAKKFITKAIEHGLNIGKGSGPVNQFYNGKE